MATRAELELAAYLGREDACEALGDEAPARLVTDEPSRWAEFIAKRDPVALIRAVTVAARLALPTHPTVDTEAHIQIDEVFCAIRRWQDEPTAARLEEESRQVEVLVDELLPLLDGHEHEHLDAWRDVLWAIPQVLCTTLSVPRAAEVFAAAKTVVGRDRLETKLLQELGS